MRCHIERDDALSPIVAFFLLLMIIVSFISLLNAYYIPSLKQQEEVKHLQSIEEVFSSFTGDITQIALFQKGVSLQERFQLGGGAALFSPVLSSGTVQLQQSSLLTLTIEDGSNFETEIPITGVTISYEPIGNFWMDQGYIWEHGLVYVTKPSKRTWLEYATEADAKKSKDFFLKSMFIPEVITNNSLSLYRIVADPNALFRSGNGMSGINLFLTKEKMVIDNVSSIDLSAAIVDGDTQDILDDIVAAWEKPSLVGQSNVTVEIYNISVSVV